MAKKPAKKSRARIVEAVGAAAASQNKDRARQIEAAMSKAVADAMAKGETDPDKIRAAMLKAREAIKA